MASSSMSVSLRNVSFTQLKRVYEAYCKDGALFREKAGAAVKLHGVPISDARYANVNTCALRVSYALHRAGLTLPNISGRSWQYVGKHRSPASLPSYAADYKDLIVGEKRIKPHQRGMLNGRKGIILFLSGSNQQAFGASGHVTLFEGVRVLDQGDYFEEKLIASIWYWDVNG